MLAAASVLLLSVAMPGEVPSTAAAAPATGATPAALAPAATGALSFPSAAARALSLRANETMEFSVSYLGVPMGKVKLFVGRVDATVAPIFLQAQTSSVLSFINIREQLATYLDVSTGLPLSATLDAVEGSYRHSDTARFDRLQHKATVREKGKFDNTYVIDVPPDTIDFVALVYHLRALPLEPGMRVPFTVLSERTVKSVVAEVVGREQVWTRAGEFRALKVRVPTGFTGKFSEKNPTYVWLSDDARRVVVQLTTDFAIGHATAGLVSYAPGEAPANETAGN